MKRLFSGVLLLAAVVAAAHAHDVRLNPLKSDDYVLRKMVVVKQSGERISSFLKIESFDKSNGTFVMKDVTGGTTNIPAADIQKIEFQQTVKQQSPMAQSAHWVARATPGSTLRYRVPQGALSVDSEELVFPASSPSTTSTGPTLPAAEPPVHPGSMTNNVTVLEPRSVTFDGASKTFTIEVQNVRYTVEMSGSSGPSGVRK
jgi:hypothetical protein